METWFELWDTQSANIVGDFETREAALGFVLDSLDSFGSESVEALVLTRESGRETDPEIVAVGTDLAELAKSMRRVNIP